MANKTEMVALRMTEQEKEQLKKIADKHDTTISQFIRGVIKEYMDKETVNG